jgi:hypothetical protein
MCALVQAVRKLGIVPAGPGLGEAVNPMHIVRDSASSRDSSSRPGTASSGGFDDSLGQSRRVVEDPTTQVDDDRQPQLGFEYYREESLERQLSGTAAVRRDDGVRRDGDTIERGRSFGRRRKQVPGDLEKGSPRVQFEQP